jgi:hypothetical protein
LKEIEKGINQREEDVRKEIIEFIQGACKRQDLLYAAPAADSKK